MVATLILISPHVILPRLEAPQPDILSVPGPFFPWWIKAGPNKVKALNDYREIAVIGHSACIGPTLYTLAREDAVLPEDTAWLLKNLQSSDPVMQTKITADIAAANAPGFIQSVIVQADGSSAVLGGRRECPHMDVLPSKNGLVLASVHALLPNVAVRLAARHIIVYMDRTQYPYNILAADSDSMAICFAVPNMLRLVAMLHVSWQLNKISIVKSKNHPNTEFLLREVTEEVGLKGIPVETVDPS